MMPRLQRAALFILPTEPFVQLKADGVRDVIKSTVVRKIEWI
jgi:hypothetical protein